MNRNTFLLLGLLGLVLGFFSSCSEDDDDVFAPGPTDELLTVNLSPDPNYTTNSFEKGESVSLSIDVDAPDGIAIYQIQKSIDGGAPINLAIDSVAFPNPPSPGENNFTANYTIEVTEDVGSTVEVIFNAKHTDDPFVSASYTYQVVPQGQGGGGGVAPLLRERVTVDLGSQGSNLGSYFASSVGAAGVYTTDQASNLSATDQAEIDITFGVTDGTNAATGGAATTPALISPDERANRNFNNALDSNATATTFRQESGISTLDEITSTDVENNISSDGSSKFAPITTGTTYSFINSDEEKGYLRVISITGQGADREAEIEVLVQILQ